MNYCLTEFHTIRPRYELDQETTLDWIAKTHARREASQEEKNYEEVYRQIKGRLNELGTGKECIRTRGAHIHDIVQSDTEEREIYPVSSPPYGTSFAEKSRFFDREILEIFKQFYPDDSPLPAQLIHVTCTGYVAPSPPQKLISLKGAGKFTTITHAYHMGCYAAFPAIRIAQGFLNLSSHPVDIVHTELCSLHMHPLLHSTEQLIVQSLFADGFIKYNLNSNPKKPHLKVLALLEEIIPESSHCMTWHCEGHGLGMTLSKEIPVLITRYLKGYLTRLCAIADRKISSHALFAVHPGGPKILHYIEQALELKPFQIQHSKEVLKEYGNMSSATLPHIWEKILNDSKVPHGTLVFTFAFGPGLSISGGIFEKCIS